MLLWLSIKPQLLFLSIVNMYITHPKMEECWHGGGVQRTMPVLLLLGEQLQEVEVLLQEMMELLLQEVGLLLPEVVLLLEVVVVLPEMELLLGGGAGGGADDAGGAAVAGEAVGAAAGTPGTTCRVTLILKFQVLLLAVGCWAA